jgi:hypothetical protein
MCGLESTGPAENNAMTEAGQSEVAGIVLIEAEVLCIEIVQTEVHLYELILK